MKSHVIVSLKNVCNNSEAYKIQESGKTVTLLTLTSHNEETHCRVVIISL
jgi:hypothetical protein